MSNQELPPNGGQPALPPNFLRFSATCTDAIGQTATIEIAALNHLGAVAALLKFLCDNPVEVRKIVFERSQQLVTPAAPRLFRG